METKAQPEKSEITSCFHPEEPRRSPFLGDATGVLGSERRNPETEPHPTPGASLRPTPAVPPRGQVAPSAPHLFSGGEILVAQRTPVRQLLRFGS